MSIPAKADAQNHPLTDFTDIPLTRARAKQIVAAIVGWSANAADELVNLLLNLGRGIAGWDDQRVERVIEAIDLLVKIAFQESKACCQYLDEYSGPRTHPEPSRLRRNGGL
jgi:hypothetical protein